ncbi:FAD-dependent oxidoreductase [Falsihalocynthiibacter arcticus]|uniref:FAD/NAD(P)-binding domain-containing protein n=1 Tax=Falsihalocynthiibacter arcticus TaxID=1579316 RepID=A0A126UZX3_9RHOB|nr:FAD-dependent oxidoreductase [Falsihalocynthiibacter arcticus]AML51621.1 hypothetical protein RC74_10415 [Falsihalocynthiibacter arcticus]
MTQKEPVFLPDDVDGHVLFTRATSRIKEGFQKEATTTIGDIVIVPPVKAARERGDLKSVRPFRRFTKTGVVWGDGTEEEVDTVIWCTGFKPATDHLRSLGIVEADGRVQVNGQQSIEVPHVWLAGYGNWTGPASATLIGSARVARALVPQIVDALAEESTTAAEF